MPIISATHRPAPPGLAAAAGEVHVWAIALDAEPDDRATLYKLLSPDERSRAATFRFDRDRNRFTVARGALRTILGHYSGVPAVHLSFRYGERGKPYLGPSDAGARLRFNLSHSGELALCAVTEAREIGVDVEHLRRRLDVDGISGRFFVESEQRALAALPAEDRPRTFFRLWTGKEAYMKSRGEGMARSPRSFEISVAEAQPPRLCHVDGLPEEPGRWRMEALTPAIDYVGTVMAEGADWELRLFRWEPV